MIVAGMILGAGQVFAETTDSKTILLEAEVADYLQLVGTSVNGATKTIDTVNTANADGTAVSSSTAKSLGTLGLTSNIPGNCTIKFTSINEFKLVGVAAGPLTPAETLNTYTLEYAGASITNGGEKANLTCRTTEPTNLQYLPNTSTQLVGRGTYTDTITVTVTSNQ